MGFDGVSIFNLYTARKELSLLRSMTGLHFDWAWGLETGDCKTQKTLSFPLFRLHFLSGETGCEKPELGLFAGSCILSGFGEFWLILVSR